MLSLFEKTQGDLDDIAERNRCPPRAERFGFQAVEALWQIVPSSAFVSMERLSIAFACIPVASTAQPDSPLALKVQE